MIDTSRRDFIRKAAPLAATTFTIIKPELVRGAGKERLKAGLVGCGSRGSQAVVDMMTGTENVDLVAVADLFEDKLEASLRNYATKPRYEQWKDRIKVAPDMHHTGFDAYKKLIASDIDIVMLATPPGYRPEHFEAAVNANKHVFCEKPFGTDAMGVKRFMAAAKLSEQKGLTVVSGAQRRFASDYSPTVDKIHNGAIGDIQALNVHWIGLPVFPIKTPEDRKPQWGEMAWQHRQWYSFVWICGDQIVEQHLHNIDVANWVMDTHPVKVIGNGGANWRPDNNPEFYGNIFDHFNCEFVYPNGARMTSNCRQIPNAPYQDVSEFVIGTKGKSNCHDMVPDGGHDPRKPYADPLENPYIREHIAFIKSVRGDGPHINHAMKVAESTMTCIMGREAAYSGMEITWEMMMNSKQDLQPKQFGYDIAMPIPPRPVPGEYKFV